MERSLRRDADPMSSSERVSVVVPTYNRAHLIQRSLESVLGQTHQDLEVLVVDDASTDDTEEVVRAFKDSRVHYLRHDSNRGPSASRNSGIRASRGRYVAFLDSDDEWVPEKLERQLSAFASNPPHGLVYCGWSWVRSDGSVRVSRVPDQASGLIDGCPRWFYNMVQDVVVLRDLAAGCLFDEAIWAYENLEWLLRLMTRASSTYVGDVLVRCHEHTDYRASDSRAKKLTGLEYILDTYESEMSGYPNVLFQIRLRAGALGLELGSRKAREHLSAAVRLRPLSARAWIRLLKTLGNGSSG